MRGCGRAGCAAGLASRRCAGFLGLTSGSRTMLRSRPLSRFFEPYTLSAATNENGTFAAIARAITRRAILGFVAKPTSLGTCAAFRRAGSSVHSFGRRVPGQGMAMPRHVGGEHPDLAIGDLARLASILACDPARGLALFQKAGLIDDQDRVLIAQRCQCVLTHNVA